MDVATPGPFLLYDRGRNVRCKVTVPRVRTTAGGAKIDTCNRVILTIGRKPALVRIVGNQEAQVSPDVGCTFRCDCGTIYEVDWRPAAWG